MYSRIEQDHTRFRQIVRGAIKQDLKKYVAHGEMIGRRGKELISIPLPQIDLPHFRYGERQTGGVGQGEGEPGTLLAPGEPGQAGQAGDLPGEHIREVEVTLDELAQMLGEALELPRVEPRGRKNIVVEKNRYSGISQTGPESLRHFRRTYKQALKRQIIAGQYDPQSPRVVPIRQDQHYRTWKPVHRPESNAVVIYMMDVSASMGDEQKEIVRTEAFWIDTWLRSQYGGIECRYLVHDAAAREVDQETFYRTRESGGTRISSAYALCRELIARRFDPQEWNIYCFHFSDGDNLDSDNGTCRELLREHLLGQVNLFCYGQVHSAYGSGAYLKHLEDLAEGWDNIALSLIRSRDEILDSIRTFLGKGK
jgi:uncharacterized sporulation protein YeaH/YhbH (DUF444 family)